MHVRLEVSHKSGKKKTVNIRSDALIGRSAECSLRIASSEISRKHCKLTIVESGVLVRDLESANGTWIDGKIIPPSQDVALPPGSRLSVGPVQFVVHYEAAAGGIEPPGSTVNLPAAAGAVAAMTPMMDVDAEEETAAIPDAPLTAASPSDGEVTDREDIDSEETIATTAAALQTDRLSPAAEPDAEVDLLDVEEVDEAEDDVPETEEPAEVAEAAEADDVAEAEVAEAEPAAAKGKRGSVFGGLLRFGRKPKEKPSEVEPADAADPGAPVEADAPAIGSPGEADAAEEEYDEGEEEYADEEYEDGEYEDEEYEEDAGEEAAEEDSQLGDFFRQFDK